MHVGNLELVAQIQLYDIPGEYDLFGVFYDGRHGYWIGDTSGIVDSRPPWSNHYAPEHFIGPLSHSRAAALIELEFRSNPNNADNWFNDAYTVAWSVFNAHADAHGLIV